MSTRIITLAALTLLWTAGCSNKDASLNGVSPDQARTMNGERSQFEASEDPPITAETHHAAGLVAQTQGDPATAIKQYRAALKLEPGHKAALYHLGVCLAQEKKFTDAVATWKKYVEVTDGDPRGYSNLGFCHELAGEIDHAEQAYQRGIEKDAKNVPCRTNYGLMLARLGRTAEATLQLQAVLTPAEVHYNLASVLEHQGRREQAKQEYEKALKLSPDFRDAQMRLSALQ